MQNETYGTRTVTAFFDNRHEADRAVERLCDLGIGRDRITMVEGSNTTAADATETQGESRGFFSGLADFFMPDEDRHSYAEGLRRGGYLVTVRAGADEYDRVIDVLDDEGAINMDEREESWRSEGWTGQSEAWTGTTEGLTDRPAATAMPATGAVDRDRDGTIEVAEERLRVGKRDVSHGRVRVRSYTVEEPVSEQVSLRSEHVEIERRPVDRPAGTGEAFQDRTLELEERAEEAVVSKEARVTEEIDLRKVAEDETRTVSDTVRHTEVEVEDDRTGAPADRRR